MDSRDHPSIGGNTVVVVPCFNEALRFDSTAFADYLAKPGTARFVFVNDGSTDGTGAMLDRFAELWPQQVDVVHLGENRGKAEAVRQGILHVLDQPKVAFTGFWDADLATPLSAIASFVEVLQRRPDIAIVVGSRVQLLGRQIDRKLTRHYLGRVFATFASLTLALPFYDTQCGAKVMRADEHTRALFSEAFGSRWVFDVEMIARHVRATGSSRGLYELPLETWRDVGESKVKPIDFVRAIGEMANIYRRYRLPRRFHRLYDLITARFVRYSGAGALGTLLHYLVLTSGVEMLDWAPAAGAMAGATVGALVNYWFNYHFTFVSERSHRQTLPRFLVVAAVGVGLNGLIVRVASQLGFHYLLGQLAATAAVLVVGFVLNRLWTFENAKEPRS